jgi:hypothetical protein
VRGQQPDGKSYPQNHGIAGTGARHSTYRDKVKIVKISRQINGLGVVQKAANLSLIYL